MVNEEETIKWLWYALMNELFENDFDMDLVDPLTEQLYAEMVWLT